MEDSIADSVLHTIALFREEGRQRSATFAYWDSFLQAGDTLLRLLRADREAKFLMHIEAVKDTVPYFVLAGRINYARYTPVYVAEMELLEEKQPLMYRHMIEGGFVVRRSKSRVFNCVPTDQALEQSINREAKSQGDWFHTTEGCAAPVADDTTHYRRICRGFQEYLQLQ